MRKTILSISIFLFLSLNVFAQDTTQAYRTFLPLGVVTMDAKAIEKNIQLIWTVSSNEDAKSFEVERSENEVNFKKIGGRLSVGRAGTETYEFVDALPKKNTAFTYRIKIIAKDGSAVYSDYRSIKITESTFDCKLKQNPVQHSIQLSITATEAVSLKTEIYTAYGQKVAAETSKLITGNNSLSLSSQNLQPGLHRLILETASERKVISFIKE